MLRHDAPLACWRNRRCGCSVVPTPSPADTNVDPFPRRGNEQPVGAYRWAERASFDPLIGCLDGMLHAVSRPSRTDCERRMNISGLISRYFLGNTGRAF